MEKQVLQSMSQYDKYYCNLNQTLFPEKEKNEGKKKHKRWVTRGLNWVTNERSRIVLLLDVFFPGWTTM